MKGREKGPFQVEEKQEKSEGRNRGTQNNRFLCFRLHIGEMDAALASLPTHSSQPLMAAAAAAAGTDGFEPNGSSRSADQHGDIAETLFSLFLLTCCMFMVALVEWSCKRVLLRFSSPVSRVSSSSSSSSSAPTASKTRNAKRNRCEISSTDEEEDGAASAAPADKEVKTVSSAASGRCDNDDRDDAGAGVEDEDAHEMQQQDPEGPSGSGSGSRSFSRRRIAAKALPSIDIASLSSGSGSSASASTSTSISSASSWTPSASASSGSPEPSPSSSVASLDADLEAAKAGSKGGMRSVAAGWTRFRLEAAAPLEMRRLIHSLKQALARRAEEQQRWQAQAQQAQANVREGLRDLEQLAAGAKTNASAADADAAAVAGDATAPESTRSAVVEAAAAATKSNCNRGCVTAQDSSGGACADAAAAAAGAGGAAAVAALNATPRVADAEAGSSDSANARRRPAAVSAASKLGRSPLSQCCSPASPRKASASSPECCSGSPSRPRRSHSLFISGATVMMAASPAAVTATGRSPACGGMTSSAAAASGAGADQ